MLNDSITLMSGADISNMVVASGTVFPSSPDTGEMFYNTTNSKLYVYDGATWNITGATSKADVGLGSVDNTADADKPISSATSTALSGKESTANKNANSGYAGLDAFGKIASAQLPALVITDTYVVASQGAMLALSAAEVGDVAVRTDTNTTYILKTTGYSTLGNWQELLSPSTGSITIGSTAIAVGAFSSTLAGLSSLSSTSISVDGLDVGTKIIPQNTKSTNYTAILSDSGKQIFHPAADTTARTFTIPANDTVSYPIGTALTFINQYGAGVVTIAITTDILRMAGSSSVGNKTLSANGIATAIKVTATEWLISGTGLA